MVNTELHYRKIFNYNIPTEKYEHVQSGKVADRAASELTYVFNEEIELAVNIALGSGRPLLVRGASGCGKSSLAPAVAARMGWSYIEHVITSRTQSKDLLYEVDVLKRLEAAQAGKLSGMKLRRGVQGSSAQLEDLNHGAEERFINPGPFFWAFSPKKARDLLRRTKRSGPTPLGLIEGAERTVVLLDEIDKADPDVPNDLLRPLGSLQFQVEEVDMPVYADPASPPLIIITTNEERDLPAAFLRRCVELEIPDPDASRLEEIGKKHEPLAGKDLLRNLARIVAESAASGGQKPSIAEYLDALRVSVMLEPENQKTKELFLKSVLWKFGRPPPVKNVP